MSNVLLHTCCAPCASACIERLRADGHDVTLFFSNANIASPEEFARRLASVCRLAEYMSVPLLSEPADHEAWLAAVRSGGLTPEGGERCRLCFAYSLRRTAAKSAELGLDCFTTSLSISPHKQTSMLFDTARTVDAEHFLAEDFKKRDGFKRSVELSGIYDFYRQRYCGCEFSRPAMPA